MAIASSGIDVMVFSYDHRGSQGTLKGRTHKDHAIAEKATQMLHVGNIYLHFPLNVTIFHLMQGNNPYMDPLGYGWFR